MDRTVTRVSPRMVSDMCAPRMASDTRVSPRMVNDTHVSPRMVSDIHAPQDGSDSLESMQGSRVYARRLVMKLKNSYQDSGVGLDWSEGWWTWTGSGQMLVVRMEVPSCEREGSGLEQPGRSKAMRVGMGRGGLPVTCRLGWRLRVDQKFGEF